MWRSSTSSVTSDVFEANPFGSGDFRVASTASIASVQDNPSHPTYLGDRTDQPVLPKDAAIASVGALMLVSLYIILRRRLEHYKALNSAPLGSSHHREMLGRRSPERAAKLPCLTCDFFSNNMYLPCALHPATALKPEAKDCTDFRPQEPHGDEYEKHR